MIITQFIVTHFRNLFSTQFNPSDKFNIIIGDNGSGKTSLLEAIYFLAVGRSFRSHLLSRVITHQQAKFTLFARLIQHNGTNLPVGVAKAKDGKRELHINGETVGSMAELVRLMPLQLINHKSHGLLEGGPKERRQFLDWGVFHVEQQFYPIWRRMSRALQQRNAALRTGQSLANIQAWDVEFIESCLLIDKLREEYVNRFLPQLMPVIECLLENVHISFRYYRGWGHELSLSALLEKNVARDRELGNTTVGAHRADLKITCKGLPAQDVLSRGQQKLLVSAMRLAQGAYLKEVTGKVCIYLIDDLPAELDADKRKQLATALVALNAQVFITATNQDDVSDFTLNDSSRVFKVREGNLM